MSLSIGRAFLIWLVGFLVLTLLLVSGLVLRHERRFLEGELEATTRALARTLAAAVAEGEAPEHLPLDAMPDLRAVEVRDGGGRLLWRFGPTSEEARAVESGLVEVRAPVPGGPQGELTLLVSPTRVHRHLLVSGERLLGALTAAMLVALLVGVALVSRIAGPLRALAAHLRSVQPAAAAPFDPPPVTVAEVVELGRSFNDLTRRLEAHETDKMQAVATLAGGVAHDFNNLLAGIQLHLRWLEREPQAAGEVVAAVRALAEEGAEVVQELLLFSRRETTPHRELDLARLVVDQGEVLRHLVPEGVTLEVDAVPGPLPVVGNPVALRRLLLNLVLNARDAVAPPRGRIRVEVALARDGALIEVEDNGSGIPEQVRQRMFEPFVSSRRDGRGAGLGLAVVYSIVRDHGGTIAVDSSPGSGTTVRVGLPVAPPVVGPAPGGDEPKTAKARVLLVEPNSRLAARVVEHLAADGLETRHVLSGETAVEVAAGWDPQVVVVDLSGAAEAGFAWLAGLRGPVVMVAEASAAAPVGVPGMIRLDPPLDPRHLSEVVVSLVKATAGLAASGDEVLEG